MKKVSQDKNKSEDTKMQTKMQQGTDGDTAKGGEMQKIKRTRMRSKGPEWRREEAAEETRQKTGREEQIKNKKTKWKMKKEEKGG